jgi:large subunit ribosomal protein L21
MYAVVTSGGKQYKIQQGEVLRVEKIPGEIGSPVTFDHVLMFCDGDDVSIGQPVLDNVLVEGHIVEQGKAKKIIVFKYKRRKRYRRKQGHRQQFTAIKINSIKAEAGKTSKKDEPKAEAKVDVTKAEPREVEAKKAVALKEEAKVESKQKEDKKTVAKKAKPEPKPTAKKTDTKKVVAKKPQTKKAATKKPVAKKTTTRKAETKKKALEKDK